MVVRLGTMAIFQKFHTAEQVAQTLIDGLDDGSIVLRRSQGQIDMADVLARLEPSIEDARSDEQE
jgi:hypothetical protein